MVRSLAKFLSLKDLDAEDVRVLLDVRERYSILLDAQKALRHSYGGSLGFEKRGTVEYLIYRPRGSSTRRSRGRRTTETEKILADFKIGKERADSVVKGLQRELEARAPLLRARGLGRVPLLAARILRKLDKIGWLGTSLTVIGTHALYAYEAKAAVRIESGMLATEDVDVLYDARRRLMVSGDMTERSLIGELRKVDRSFGRPNGRTYTAMNADGYMVDLIEPQDHERIMHRGAARLSDAPDDLVATTTDSSRWLLNTPKFETIAIDEKGLPLRIITLDPRVYALQKQWIVENDPTRDPAKRGRDRQQAVLVATLARRHLGLSFDDPALSALPHSFRRLAEKLDDLPSDDGAAW